MSRPGSDHTWNAIQGIKFTSRHESTPTPKVSHLTHGLPSQVSSLQKDPSRWTQPQTQQTSGPRDEDHEGCPPSNDGLFRTPLGFHIPPEKLRNAMLAEPPSSAAYWHYTLYQGPGGDRDKVKVHYCKNKEATEKIAQLFLGEEIVGFDIEWNPNSMATDGITKNVALIQIASEERVLLAHIARYPSVATSERQQQKEDFVAPSLKKIMYGSSRCRFVPDHIPS